MNPLWSVIIGGALTLLGSLLGGFLTNLFTLRKERQQWERQQLAEQQKSRREEEKQAREQLRETYINCVRNLTQFMEVVYPDVVGLSENNEDLTKLSDDKKEIYFAEEKRYKTERTKYAIEAENWLLLLRVRLQNINDDDMNKFDVALNSFFKERHTADELRELVLQFMRNDARLVGYELPPAHTRSLPRVDETKQIRGVR